MEGGVSTGQFGRGWDDHDLYNIILEQLAGGFYFVYLVCGNLNNDLL